MDWNELASLPFGGFTDGNGWSYQFALSDIRWLCPALVGETTNIVDQECICGTMLQRLYIIRDHDIIVARGGDEYPYSYYGVLRAYSQPVIAYFLEHGTTEDEQRRAEIDAMTPDQIPPATLDLAIRFVTGQVAIRPEWVGLVDFAACDCSGCGRDTHGPETLKLDNCFWRDSSWPSGLVLQPVSGTGTSSAIIPLAAGALLAALGIWAWRTWG